MDILAGSLDSSPGAVDLSGLREVMFPNVRRNIKRFLRSLPSYFLVIIPVNPFSSLLSGLTYGTKALCVFSNA